MRHWLLFFLLMISTAAASAQGAAADTAFRFTHPVSRSVNHWVAFPKQSNIDAYPFGYVYIDPSQGFLFNLQGFFKVNGNGTFTLIKQKIDEATREYYNLKPGPKPLVAHIEQDHDVELDIDPRPDWFANYNDYTDTAAHCVEWARAYNGIKDSEMAVAILLEPYKTAPRTPGLEQELAHAYNALKQSDKAIKIAETALLYNVGEPGLYKELGNAQLGLGRFNDALATYATGIKLCDAGHAEEKAEMAMYTALAYSTNNNKEGYKKWIVYAKMWAPRKSAIAAVLEEM